MNFAPEAIPPAGPEAAFLHAQEDSVRLQHQHQRVEPGGAHVPLAARRKAGGPVRWTWRGPSRVLWLPGARQDGSGLWRAGGKPPMNTRPAAGRAAWPSARMQQVGRWLQLLVPHQARGRSGLCVEPVRRRGGRCSPPPNWLQDNHRFTQQLGGQACSLLGPSSCLLGPGFRASAGTASLPPGNAVTAWKCAAPRSRAHQRGRSSSD